MLFSPQEGNFQKFRNPKIIFGFILFLAVIGVGASGYRISSGIRGGFVPDIVNRAEVNPAPTNTEDGAALKLKDTDADGLNDFDELNVYKTSPYLADTDSDGTSDAAEVQKQTDPNCPEGRDCREVAPATPDGLADVEQDIMTEATAGLGSADSVGAGRDLSLQGETTEVSGSEETNTQLKNLTPSQIRTLLLDSGKVTKEQLDGIDDETLMKAYEEIVKSSQ